MYYIFGSRLRRPAVMAALVLCVLFSYGCSRDENKEGRPGVGEAETTDALTVSQVDSAKTHFDRGVEYARTGKFDKAIEEYAMSIESNPHSAEAHNNLGFAYLDKGDFESAIRHQRKALAVNPELANGYYGLALALERKGETSEAVKNWEEFMKRSEPGSKWTVEAQKHIEALKPE
jgi:tetratricopeptide (TPR) repeat protein